MTRPPAPGRTTLRAYLPNIVGSALILAACTLLAVTGILQSGAALTLGVTGVAILLAARELGSGQAPTWTRSPLGRRAGARDEISEHAWMLFGRDRNISFGGHRYLVQVAEQVLLTEGLELRNPAHNAACTALLGASIMNLLAPEHPTLDIKDARTIVAALDNIITQPQQRMTHG